MHVTRACIVWKSGGIRLPPAKQEHSQAYEPSLRSRYSKTSQRFRDATIAKLR